MIYPAPSIFDWTRFGLLPLLLWSRTAQSLVKHLEPSPGVSSVVPKRAQSKTALIVDLHAYREHLSKRYGGLRPRFRPAPVGREG